ncbi:MAG: transcription antitermination factor NusB [Planctomycetota bacterium]|mgnify:FL=1|nr:transcription antitermination factor NusB [Planctomycetota bacterium]MDG2142752.1 transcription antitermination factor NusB [Planctomycetota bacterium]
MKKRTRARELVLQALYQLDLQGDDFIPEIGNFVSDEEEDASTAQFAIKIAKGVVVEIEVIDNTIRKVAQNWDIERMAVIDRNILRMATHEILHMDEIPPKVSINEAIELGKRFSTKNSGAFINGILDRIKTRAAEDAEAGDDITDDEPAAAAEGETLE